MGQVQQRPGQQVVQQTGKGGKPMKDPNAPKKPLSAYFLFSQEERLKVKEAYPDYSITEVAKELGRRWASIDPAVKQSYEQRYQESRRQYEQALQVQFQPIFYPYIKVFSRFFTCFELLNFSRQERVVNIKKCLSLHIHELFLNFLGIQTSKKEKGPQRAKATPQRVFLVQPRRTTESQRRAHWLLNL